MAILVDINGTIASEGKPIQKTIDYLKTVKEDIYVISGSTESKRKHYEDLLKSLEISYVKLILNPLNENTDIYFKSTMAQGIPDLTLAIDNNPKILKAYRSVGIKAISHHDLTIP